jgi:hypothetical protein
VQLSSYLTENALHVQRMIIAYSKNNTNKINTLCGQNAEFYDILTTAEVEMNVEWMITPLKL